MPTPTPKLGILKPLGNETVNRSAFNQNWDIIDTAAQKNIVQGTSAPASPVEGDLWIDTSTTPNALKRYTSGAWMQVGVVNWTDILGKPSAFPPSAHKNTHAAGGSDPLTPADIGATPSSTFSAHVSDYTAHMSPDEKTYWMDRAALLDPRAYSYANSTSISITVPAGETWYALNLWNIKVGSNYLFQRVLDVNRALMLPSGTTLQTDGTVTGFYYICRPKSVFDIDARYANDPKGLYYNRINKLRSMLQYDLTVNMPAGSPRGTQVTANFPTDFSYGLAVLASCHDMAWVILDNNYGGMNTQNEISDDHAVRFAEAIMVPFKVADFPRIRGRAGSTSGNTTDTSLQGYGGVKYFKLPADW